MQPTAKVQELLQVLKDRGLNEDAITNVQEGLWEQASEAFVGDLIRSLRPSDLEQVENVETQEAANAELRKIYQEKTGKDMDEEMKRMVDEQAEQLIEKYRVGRAEPIVSSSTDGQTEDVPVGAQIGDKPEEKSDEKPDEIHDLT